jgi:maleylpyruvate isomerase
MKLYSFFRSSAAYRVRIALNLKHLAYETISVHLVKDGGHNKRPEFRAVNPQMRIPTFVAPTGEVLIQSLAIIEYLDETHPDPPLLPKEPIARAHVRALADVIACDIHQLNNVGPLRYLKNEMHQEQSAIDSWYHHWVLTGFEALERWCGRRPTPSAPR